NTDDLFVGKTLLHGDVLMWLMKTLLTSGCTNQRGAGHTTQKASAGVFDGVFFTGRWWPFFVSITQRPHLRGGGYEIHG
ncbi:hypothetical protein ACLEUJ_25775, partial [Escherichia coli]